MLSYACLTPGVPGAHRSASASACFAPDSPGTIRSRAPAAPESGSAPRPSSPLPAPGIRPPAPLLASPQLRRYFQLLRFERPQNPLQRFPLALPATPSLASARRQPPKSKPSHFLPRSPPPLARPGGTSTPARIANSASPPPPPAAATAAHNARAAHLALGAPLSATSRGPDRRRTRSSANPGNSPEIPLFIPRARRPKRQQRLQLRVPWKDTAPLRLGCAPRQNRAPIPPALMPEGWAPDPMDSLWCCSPTSTPTLSTVCSPGDLRHTRKHPARRSTSPASSIPSGNTESRDSSPTHPD